MAVPTPASTPLVVAHRGFHPDEQPYENSLKAFDAAITAGADVVETDVHRTLDGVLVLNHDELIDGLPIATTFYADLPLLPDGQKIPTLDQAVNLIRTRGSRICVELKGVGYEREVVDHLLAGLPPSQFEITSFNSPSITAIEQYHSEVRTGILAPRMWEWMRNSFAWPVITHAFDFLHLARKRVESSHADFLSVDERTATNSLLNDAQAHGIPVDVWTVDDPKHIERLMHDPRVSGVVTNRTDVAVAARPQSIEGAATIGWENPYSTGSAPPLPPGVAPVA